MGLMSDADRAQMANDVAAIVSDNSVSIAIRRGSVTLPAQTVRLARMGSAGSRRADSGGIEQSDSRIVVLGAAGLDIGLGDRFNDGDGQLYEVDFVRPNRRTGTQAEARVIQ